MAPSVDVARDGHGEGYRGEKKPLLTETKGKKTQLLLGPGTLPGTTPQDLGLLLCNFFLPTII